jgi:hypothetical protein
MSTQYSLTIKVIIPKKYMEDAIGYITALCYDNMNAYMGRMTERILEKLSKNVQHKIEYNGKCVKNGSYIYSIVLQSKEKHHLYPVFLHHPFTKMLDNINPYVANKTFRIKNMKTKSEILTHAISIGHNIDLDVKHPPRIDVSAMPVVDVIVPPNAPKKRRFSSITADCFTDSTYLNFDIL